MLYFCMLNFPRRLTSMTVQSGSKQSNRFEVSVIISGTTVLIAEHDEHSWGIVYSVC
jgi:hypothetical protein